MHGRRLRAVPVSVAAPSIAAVTCTDEAADSGGTWRLALAWARRMVAGAVLVGGLALLATDHVQVCEQQMSASAAPAEFCHPPHLDDPLVLGVVLLVLFLLGPDLAEFGVPGLVTLRWRLRAHDERLDAADQRAVALEAQLVQVSAGVAASSTARQEVTVNFSAPASGDQTARLAAGEGTTGEAELPEEVVEARFLAAQHALSGLLHDVPGALGGATLHLFYPSEDEQLLPVFEPEQPREQVGWPSGVGVVGRAWATGEAATGAGEALRDVGDLPPQRAARYADLVAVAAVPVLNGAGRPIAVLSASSRESGHRLDARPAVEALTVRAALAARILIDLLGWDDDSPGEDPADAQPPDVGVDAWQGRQPVRREGQYVP